MIDLWADDEISKVDSKPPDVKGAVQDTVKAVLKVRSSEMKILYVLAAATINLLLDLKPFFVVNFGF